MKYGQIAGNKSLNAVIYRCFEYIDEMDVQAFVKKFREQPDDSDQIMQMAAGLFQIKECVRYEELLPDDSFYVLAQKI